MVGIIYKETIRARLCECFSWEVRFFYLVSTGEIYRNRVPLYKGRLKELVLYKLEKKIVLTYWGLRGYLGREGRG